MREETMKIIKQHCVDRYFDTKEEERGRAFDILLKSPQCPPEYRLKPLYASISFDEIKSLLRMEFIGLERICEKAIRLEAELAEREHASCAHEVEKCVEDATAGASSTLRSRGEDLMVV